MFRYVGHSPLLRKGKLLPQNLFARPLFTLGPDLPLYGETRLPLFGAILPRPTPRDGPVRGGSPQPVTQGSSPSGPSPAPVLDNPFSQGFGPPRNPFYSRNSKIPFRGQAIQVSQFLKVFRPICPRALDPGLQINAVFPPWPAHAAPPDPFFPGKNPAHQ